MANSFFKSKDIDNVTRLLDVEVLDDGDLRTVLCIGDRSITAAVAPVDAIRGLRVNEAKASTPSRTDVGSSVTSVTIRAANVDRRALIVFNDSNAILKMNYGATASAADFTYLLQPGELHREELYTGIVTGIWVTANGFARTNELTA